MLERLVSSSEAAQILGLSLQGVHYRIKKGKLKATKKDGKTFVYIDDSLKKLTYKEIIPSDIKNLLIVKDEQILFLKEVLQSTKKQYKKEINRLEKNQDQIVKVFKSEIDLLQSAFNEMRSVYKIDHKTSQIKDDKNTTLDFSIMDIKDFFIFMKQSKKSDTEIKSLILDRIRQGDKRFIFNRETKEVLIYKSDFMDLI